MCACLYSWTHTQYLAWQSKKEKNTCLTSSERCHRSHMLVGKSEGHRSGVVRALHLLFEWQLAARVSREGRFDLSLWHLQGQNRDNLTELLRRSLTFKLVPFQTSLLCTVRLLWGSSAIWRRRGPSPVDAGCKEQRLLKALTKTTFLIASSNLTSPTEVNAATKLINVGIVSNFPA